MSTVLICGLGGVGSYAAEFLARTVDVTSIVCIDANATAGEAVAIRASAGSAVEGYNIPVTFVHQDLRNVESTAELLARINPVAILHCATLLPIRAMATALPSDIFGRLRVAGFGTWLPVNALLSIRLMQAVKLSGITTNVIDVPFPDFINPLLTGMGLPVLAGCGNIDNLVGQLRVGIATERGTSVADITVGMVAPHAVAESFQRTSSSQGMAYYARVSDAAVDVTGDHDIEAILGSTSTTINGAPLDARVAASGVAMIAALARDETAYVHAAGPVGRIGGYPVLLSRGGTEVVLPNGLSDEEANAINASGIIHGGIQNFTPSGSVQLTAAASETMQDIFGVDISLITPDSVEAQADELLAAYRSFLNGLAS
ncbi:MAG: hypothetical protein JWM76_4113 [Pseudonocardiales bacterium]|nr:hypothetical protein [Pseudonocardiales bacterium]